MKVVLKTKTVLFLIVLPIVINAQTVNTGEIVVSEGTIMSTVADFNNTPTGDFINDGDVYVYANWNNDGSVDFLSNTGLTRFISNSNQTISGSNFSYFYNVLYDNPSAQPAFALSGDISIANEAEFNLGIVDNDNFGGEIAFEQNGIAISTSDDSHVDGTVTKNGDTDFTYPIGDRELYRFAAISAPNAETEVYTGKYFFESTDASYPTDNLGNNVVLVDEAEFWQIEQVDGDTQVLLTLSWSEATTPSEILEDPIEALKIVRWDETLELWVNEGGVVDEANQTVTTAVSDYGIFTFGRIRNNTVLPCSLEMNTLITPNGDLRNDFLSIEAPTGPAGCVNNIAITIFNRWGVEVFQNRNYDNVTNVFRGFSDGRATIDRGNRLPVGTYFYILEVDFNSSSGGVERFKKADYLYINNN